MFRVELEVAGILAEELDKTPSPLELVSVIELDLEV